MFPFVFTLTIFTIFIVLGLYVELIVVQKIFRRDNLEYDILDTVDYVWSPNIFESFLITTYLVTFMYLLLKDDWFFIEPYYLWILAGLFFTDFLFKDRNLIFIRIDNVLSIISLLGLLVNAVYELFFGPDAAFRFF